MKWINHSLIAGATTAVVNPVLVPPAVLGATAPDWFEWVLNGLGGRVRHRTVTHYLSVWAVCLGFFLLVWDFRAIGAAFTYGGLSHILCDALTASGVPFGPWSDRRFHLFGGRLRTGDPAEYGISFGVVAICAVSFIVLGASGWYPFFYDWAGLYNTGIIDGAEWRANRFRFF
uniref:Inner membrane protein n=1 Tax=Candidatus Kentrum sp. DK TaxID=2126562 RepID=A0A450TKI0_9GAMM|nr:MAG: inner membrane protein [Candidatus Kentron sp. DK]